VAHRNRNAVFEVRSADEVALVDGETLSGFVLEAIQLNIQHRALQQEFLVRGLAARDEARRTGKYVSEEEVMAGLDKALARSPKAVSRKWATRFVLRQMP
jgi:hypothetical protein